MKKEEWSKMIMKWTKWNEEDKMKGNELKLWWKWNDITWNEWMNEKDKIIEIIVYKDIKMEKQWSKLNYMTSSMIFWWWWSVSRVSHKYVYWQYHVQSQYFSLKVFQKNSQINNKWLILLLITKFKARKISTWTSLQFL